MTVCLKCQLIFTLNIRPVLKEEKCQENLKSEKTCRVEHRASANLEKQWVML